MTPPATRKRTASKAPAKKTTAKKSAAKKTAAKKTAAKNTSARPTAKKTAAKRSPARRTTSARAEGGEAVERRSEGPDDTSRSTSQRATRSSRGDHAEGQDRERSARRARSGSRSGSGSSSSSSSRSSSSSSSGSGDRQVPASVAARRAAEEFGELTSTPVERVVSVRRTDDGWTVQVEALELRRTPPTMDVMGLYEVQLSSRGQVAGWDRVTRYHRSQVEGS